MNVTEKAFANDAPWKVARDQERTACQRRLDEAKQATGPLQSEEIEPESAFERAMREGLGAALDMPLDMTKPSSGTRALSLEGAEMIAYVRVKAASAAAMAAQQAHQAAGAELRAAIEAMCQLMAPPVK